MSDNNTPDYQSADYTKRSMQWEFVDTILGGTATMREAAETMLPQFPAEADDVYSERVDATTFDNDYQDTLDGIVGMIFRRPAQPADNVPAPIKQHLENIDLAGTNFNLFAPRFFRKGVHYGASYIVVDMQKVQQDQAGQIDEATARALNLRPYWTMYGGNQVQSRPRYVVIRGARTLQQIVFRVCVLVPDGDFGEKAVTQYRVWRLPVERLDNGQYEEAGFVEWQIWEEQEDAQSKQRQIVMTESGTMPQLTRLPVAPFVANPDWYDELICAGPTLYDLADLCRKDYNQQSDHEANLHLCNSPIPFTVNVREGGIASEQPWGKGIRFDCDENGTVGYAEPQGTGLQAMERQLAKNKEAIRKKGLEMVVEGGTVQTTATEQVLRASKRSSRLALMAEALKDCLESALQFHAQLMGLGEDAGGELTMGVKGEELTIAPEKLRILFEMTQGSSPVLPVESLLDLMIRAEELPDDFNKDEAVRLLERQKADIGAQIERQFNAGVMA